MDECEATFSKVLVQPTKQGFQCKQWIGTLELEDNLCYVMLSGRSSLLEAYSHVHWSQCDAMAL